MQLLRPDIRFPLSIPFVLTALSAGFPSPAEDYIDKSIDLNRELIKHPSSTFIVRVSGHSMQDAGINSGDLLIVDKSITPKNNMVAVCVIDGEFTLKRINLDGGSLWLMPANPAFKPIPVTPENDFLVWGIVTHAIKSFSA